MLPINAITDAKRTLRLIARNARLRTTITAANLLVFLVVVLVVHRVVMVVLAASLPSAVTIRFRGYPFPNRINPFLRRSLFPFLPLRPLRPPYPFLAGSQSRP